MNTGIAKRPVIDLPLSALTLTIGEWKKLFTEHQCKVVIAEALNYCVSNEGLAIAGYLIVPWRVCLVLQIKPSLVNRMLVLFYEQVRKEIRQHLEKEEKLAVLTDELYVHLFRKYPLRNEHLVKLITGREVHLPYYDPHLARLKDRIHNYNFCSAMDYSGAKGPVIVKLLHEK